ncbi:MAG: PQQ-dependent sugar dehydrogenase [Nitrosopumilus sp.]|nr:PQQ-dependent sugar dehydrogenase [Nitrosopumilus sp.]
MSDRVVLHGLKLTALFLFIFVISSQDVFAASVNDPDFVVEEYIPGILFPTSIDFIGDDLLILEKNTGKVLLVRNDTLQTTPVLDVTVTNMWERGLLGIESVGNDVYLFHTLTNSTTDGEPPISDNANHVYQYTWNGTNLINPTFLKEFPSTPGASHNGGVMTKDASGNVFVVMGDVERDGPLQNFPFNVVDDTSVIMQINPPGPYKAMGIRNSFGLTIDPITGNMWDTENGLSTYDEINMVPDKFNSGWEVVMGPANQTQIDSIPGYEDFVYDDPEFSFSPTIGITGIWFMDSPAFPDYSNSVFVGDCNNGYLYKFELNQTRTGFVFNNTALSDLVRDPTDDFEELIFGTGFGCTTDIETGPDGFLYVVSIENQIIYRIMPDTLNCLGEQTVIDGVCVDPICIGNQTLIDHVCVDPTCVGQQTVIDGVCVDPTCIGDQTVVDGICVDPTCVGDQTLENGVCVDPICVGDQTVVNGICTDPICIGDQTLIDHVCVDPTCTGDQVVIDGICVDPMCIGDQTLVDGVCVDPVCESEQVLIEGLCLSAPVITGLINVTNGTQISWTQEPPVAPSFDIVIDGVDTMEEYRTSSSPQTVDSGECFEVQARFIDQLFSINSEEACLNPTCIGDQVLTNGICVDPTCIGDQVLTNGICVDPTCIGDQTVVDGLCVDPTCTGEQILIDGVCEDTSEVVLQAQKDNTIFSEDGTKSCGACNNFFVGATGNSDIRRALVEFNVTSIPPNSIVSDVEFEFVVSKTVDSESQIMDIHKVTNYWGEEESTAESDFGQGEGQGGPAFEGDATWSHRLFSTDLWNSTGADFVALPSANVSLSHIPGVHTTSSNALMVSDVQGWVNGSSTNYGWLLKLNSTGELNHHTARAIDSRNFDGGTSPIIRVTFGPAIPSSDIDMDGVPNDIDNCPTTPNPGQEDNYGTTAGDACEDTDSDTVLDDADNCPLTPNPGQEDNYGFPTGDACEDTDSDTVLDDIDNCPTTQNPGQEDNYGTSAGDACEDTDSDSILDDTDNCPNDENVDQKDLDMDGTGDACDPLNEILESKTVSTSHSLIGDLIIDGSSVLTLTNDSNINLSPGSKLVVKATSGFKITPGSWFSIS